MLDDKLAELIAEPGVTEVCELRSRFGFLALHGGSLEQVTDYLALEAAARGDASVYAIVQPPGFRWHVPAIAMRPSGSPALRAFLQHVDTVVSIHGFGIDSLFVRGRNGADPTHPDGSVKGFAADAPYQPADAILLGGQNRELAARVGTVLRRDLADYDVVDDLDHIPTRLRGMHPDNPVNLPRQAGVQLECCPGVRGLGPRWRHLGPGERAPQTERFVAALASVARLHG